MGPVLTRQSVWGRGCIDGLTELKLGVLGILGGFVLVGCWGVLGFFWLFLFLLGFYFLCWVFYVLSFF